jgi:hypothetical protein
MSPSTAGKAAEGERRDVAVDRAASISPKLRGAVGLRNADGPVFLAVSRCKPTVQFAIDHFSGTSAATALSLQRADETPFGDLDPQEVDMRQPPSAVLLAQIGIALAPAPNLAAAPRRQRSARQQRVLTNCPAFHQSRVGNEGLRFELHNTCALPVVCALSWSVHCRGSTDSPGERASTLELAIGATDSVVASGSACGRDGWDIDGIRWSCQPQSVGHDDAAGAKAGDL